MDSVRQFLMKFYDYLDRRDTLNKLYLKLLSLCLSIIMLFSLSACGKEIIVSKKYTTNPEYYILNREIAAENNKLCLYWDDNSGVIKLLDKQTGTFWTTASAYDSEINYDDFPNPQLKSPIMVEYLEKETANENVLTAYAHSMYKETFSAEEINNGVKVTYYFDSAQIAVPVRYILEENHLRVCINPNELEENENKILNISIMPFLCSVKNTYSQNDSYLFVPSGSGALIYPKEIGDGVVSVISQGVYGRDKMNGVVEKDYGEEVRIPVYGAKIKDNAILAIIDKGADNAEIVSNVGSSTYGYSSVYTSFNVRGGYYCESTYMNWYTSKRYLYNDNMIKNEISVSFYPLSNQDANYSGMARVYKDYLKNQKGLTSNNSDNLLNIKFVGGIQSTDYTLGIPHDKLLVATTYDEIDNITDEIINELDCELNLLLRGFTNSGLMIDKIAGGFKNESSFGNVKELKKIDQKDKVNLFLNFDIMRYYSKGGGVNRSDFATTTVGEKLYITDLDISTAQESTELGKYLYVKRDKLSSLAQQAVSTIKDWQLSGVGFDTLSSYTYSDSTDRKFYAKSNSENQISAIFSGVDKSGVSIATVSANSFAALKSKHIFDVPTASKGYQIYDCDVPFYSMVFKGIRSMSGSSLNFDDNPKANLLKAAESGLGLTYTLIGEYNRDLINSHYNEFYNADYSSIKESMFNSVKEYEKLFNAVRNTEILSNEIINVDLRKSVFANGIQVYVNYGLNELEIEGIKIPAESFVMVKG